MTTPTSRVSLLLGTTAAALLLAACGSTELGEPRPAGSETPSGPVVTATPTESATGTASMSPSPSGDASASTSGGASRDTEAELDVEDQRGDGRTVVVEEASTTSGKGFVAIYRGSRLLGSVPIGNPPLTVELDTRVPATGELEAVLFGDDGDGKFDPAVDPRLEDEDFDYTLT